MRDEVKKIYRPINDLWGLPQTYKGINFYPIKLKDDESQSLFYKIFQYPKDYITDIKIIKMSYLKYLIFIIQALIHNGGEEIKEGLIQLLKNVTHENDVEILFRIFDTLPGETLDKVLIKIKIGNVEFDEEEFQDIREIILTQNNLSIEYVESYDDGLEKILQSKMNDGDANASFEEQVATLACQLNCALNQLFELTLYQFKLQFERANILLAYKLYEPLEVSGQIKSKSGDKIVKHYLSAGTTNKQSRYDSILISWDNYQEKRKDVLDPNWHPEKKD